MLVRNATTSVVVEKDFISHPFLIWGRGPRYPFDWDEQAVPRGEGGLLVCTMKRDGVSDEKVVTVLLPERKHTMVTLMQDSMRALPNETNVCSGIPRDRFDDRDIIWEVEDAFTHTIATPIRDPNGDPTGFSMVYGKTARGFLPSRPVSSVRYTPISTQSIIDVLTTRLAASPHKIAAPADWNVRVNASGTRIKMFIPFGDQVKIDSRPFDAGTEFVQHGMKVRTDNVQIGAWIDNSYDASCGIRVRLGAYRLVCRNGLMVPVDGFTTRAIHTIHEVRGVIENVAKQEVEGVTGILRGLLGVTLTNKQLESVLQGLPKKYVEQGTAMVANGNNTAWAALNYLSYVQTHVYSLDRSTQIEKNLDRVFRLAA